MGYIGVRRGLKNPIAHPLSTRHAYNISIFRDTIKVLSWLLFLCDNPIKYEKLRVIYTYRYVISNTISLKSGFELEIEMDTIKHVCIFAD